MLLKIKWQDRITNEVLERSQSTGIEALLIAAQLRWAGHVWRTGDKRMPKQLLYGELWEGRRHRGGQRKRFKDTLKQNMKQCGISVDQWETVAGDRARWRAGIKQGVELFEAKRLAAMGEMRATRKNHLQQQTGGCRRRRPQVRLRCLSARLPLANRAHKPFAHAQERAIDLVFFLTEEPR